MRKSRDSRKQTQNGPRADERQNQQRRQSQRHPPPHCGVGNYVESAIYFLVPSIHQIQPLGSRQEAQQEASPKDSVKPHQPPWGFSAW